MPKYPSDIKGFKPVVYLRISTDEQSPQDKKKPIEKRSAFKNQLAKIEKYLKANKLPMPKPENIHYELASGGDPTRPILKRAINQAVNAKGNSVFVVSELSRFHRDIRHGMAETIPLYENGIPLLVTDDNLITGTKQAPEGDSDILMGLKISLATGERERLRKRVKGAIAERQSQGIFASKGLELYPEADGDIYQYVIDNLDKAESAKQGGIGFEQFRKQLEVVYGSKTPFTNAFVRTSSKRIRELKGEMSEDEFEQWNNFRKRILEMERMFGKEDFRMKAVRYRSNGFITDPLNPSYSQIPTEEIIQNAIDNPAENLSFKDAKKYRSRVSKRGKK